MDTELHSKTKYSRLVQQLQQLIQDRTYQTDKCLPSERELCEQYNVSRITVRRALSELEEAGSIYRVQGKGAFVRSEKFPVKLSQLTSLTENMQDLNLSCGSQILALETVPAATKIAQKLNIEENAQVVVLKRLRLAGGKPLAIETCYLPWHIGALVQQHIADDVSLYSIFREHCGVSPVYAEQTLEIGLLQPWEQRLLGENTPVYAMFTTRQSFDAERNPLEYVEGKYRGDRYTYHISMTSEHSIGWSHP